MAAVSCKPFVDIQFIFGAGTSYARSPNNRGT